MALPGSPHRVVRAAQQYIYKNVLRMEEAGLVTRENSRNGKNIVFKLDPRFVEPAEESVSLISSPNDVKGNNHAVIAGKLREKLAHYKLELLTSIGEAEAYDALCGEIPQIRSEAQELYNQVRDRSSKLLGNVKALESLLAKYQAI